MNGGEKNMSFGKVLSDEEVKKIEERQIYSETHCMLCGKAGNYDVRGALTSPGELNCCAHCAAVINNLLLQERRSMDLGRK